MISGWLKNRMIVLGLSMGILCGVMAMAIAQSRSTSNVRINDVSFRVQTQGIPRLEISSSTTSQNGVGTTCVHLNFGDNKAGSFCEDITSGASRYVCEASRVGMTVSGNCTCTGVCAGLVGGCTQLGGAINMGTCEF
jgi:hypothetical protein